MSAKILCVDDDPKNLRLLEAILLPQGHNVEFAVSAEDALQKISVQLPDLVLLDIMMPGLSGFEALKRLRSNEETRLIPVVLLTALREEEDRIKGIESGCDDFISKPFEKLEVLARVKSLLKISFYRRQLDEKEKFQAVINEIGDGVIVCGPDCKIKTINNSAARYLNISDTRNINLVDFIFDNFIVSLRQEEIIDLAQARKVFEVIRPATEKNKPLYLEVSRDVLRAPSGEISSMVMLLRDVTDIRREEMIKQNFLGLVSHKMLTPLTIILSSADLFQASEPGPKHQELARGIYANALKMNTLIGKILKFSALDTQRMDLPTEELNFCEYIAKIIEPVSAPLKGKKVNIRVNCVDKELKIRMNRVYFDLIIGNLTENAIKFNDKETIDIIFEAEKSGSVIQVSISDNGPGIPPEESENIFKKFYQIEKYFTGNVDGVGIGLALVKQLIEAHGGRISVEPNLGRGAKFVITLPA